MMLSLTSTAQALTAPLPIFGSSRSSTATGNFYWGSNCPYSVWFQVVPQNGGNLPCPSDEDGVSIKLGLKDFTNITPVPITQVEVAWNETVGSIVYDTSDLNAFGPSPFYEHGYVMWSNVAASAEFPLCNTVHCAAGENPCTDSYWYGESVNPTTGESLVNHIHTCSDTSDLYFVACSG